MDYNTVAAEAVIWTWDTEREKSAQQEPIDIMSLNRQTTEEEERDQWVSELNTQRSLIQSSGSIQVTILASGERSSDWYLLVNY